MQKEPTHTSGTANSPSKDPSNETIADVKGGVKREFSTGEQGDMKAENVNVDNLVRQFEERANGQKQQIKPIVMPGLHGRVKWFSVRAGYGFIQRDDGEGDVFVHQMGIAKSHIRVPRYRSLADGEEVEFDLVQGRQGLEAANVGGPNGQEVKGVPVVIMIGNDKRRLFSEGTDNNNRRTSRSGIPRRRFASTNKADADTSAARNNRGTEEYLVKDLNNEMPATPKKSSRRRRRRRGREFRGRRPNSCGSTQSSIGE